jgi:hypothetical protein
MYKIYARVVNKRFRTTSEAVLQEEQNGFRTGLSTTDNIFYNKYLKKEGSLDFKHILSL